MQIKYEFDRFKKYLGNVKTAVFFGGHPIVDHRKLLKEDPPHIVIGTPGRVLGLAKEGALNLNTVKFFVLDECDKMLDQTGMLQFTAFALSRAEADLVSFPHPSDMRADVQEIFKKTPHDKQVMMFSATLSETVKPVCKKFMNNVRGSFPTTIKSHKLRQRRSQLLVLLARATLLWTSCACRFAAEESSSSYPVGDDSMPAP